MPRIFRSERGARCGESHPHAHLSDDLVRKIRDWHEFGLDNPVTGRAVPLTVRQIAETLAVSLNTIRGIVYYGRRNVLPDWSRMR